MKKNFFFILPLFLAITMVSCAGDQCDLNGKWNVKSVDIQSSKWPESIVSMTKSEYMKSTYQFNNDGTLLISGANALEPNQYNWSQNSQKGTIEWKGQDEGSQTEIYSIQSCSETELNLVQRIPSDPAQEESATINMVLGRAE